METIDNLSRPRPEMWTQGHLYRFIEECWHNSVGIVGNKNIIARRLTAIDTIFEETHSSLRPASHAEVIPALLMLRSFSAFRASVMVALCLPADSFPLQRSCLESAGYGRLIATEPELSVHWLKRDEDPQARNRFRQGVIRQSIATVDEKLATIYQDLYERTIDFGAHPNEKAVLTNVVPESIGTGNLQMWMLGGDGPGLDHALRTCAQVGICSLKVFALVFKEHFAKYDFETKIQRASLPF